MCFAVLMLAAAAQAAIVPGEFTLSADGDGWRIALTRADTIVDGRRTLRVAARELDGFQPSALAIDGSAVRFWLKREAGVFEFKGQAAAGGASGKFEFTPDPQFSQRVRGLVRNWWEPGVAFDVAAGGRLPLPAPPLRPEDERLRNLRERGVTSEYLRLLRQTNYDALSDTNIIEMRSRGITSLDLQEFQMRGYRDLPVDEMVRIKNDGFRDRPPQK